MQNYELLFILPGTLSEDEVKPIVETVKQTVLDNGGSGATIEDMGKSRLAYPMKHIRYGYYFLSHFSAENTDAVKLEKKLRLNTALLRVIVRKFNPSSIHHKITFAETVPTTSTIEQAATLGTVIEMPKEESEKEVEVKEIKKEKPAKKAKVNLDDIDKKLDEILEIDIDKV